MTSKTILTVEDSNSMRQMIGYILRSAGYNVVEAEDGSKGLAQAQSAKFDLVLTDQNMPNMDGLSLIKALRQMPEYKSTPVIMLTTEASDTMKQRGREAGATGWMVKPFDPNRLLEVCQKLLGSAS
jgi:two-component system, chemotaxis family, chemotaxis protein CheY